MNYEIRQFRKFENSKSLKVHNSNIQLFEHSIHVLHLSDKITNAQTRKHCPEQDTNARSWFYKFYA